jgi:hypothetical protein
MGVYRGITQDNVTIQGGTAYSLNLVTPAIGGTTLLATAAEINAAADTSTRLVSASAATLAVTVADHDQKIIVLSRAAGGVTATLPAATGSGAVFRFLIGTPLSSGSYIIKVADASGVMRGTITVSDDTDGSTGTFGTVAASDTITLNGGTTGGKVGGLITVIDIANNTHSVTGATVGTGTEATPFGSTV